MASSSAVNVEDNQPQKSRKRKRNSGIPGFARAESGSTPVVTSQAPRAINAEQFASARAVEIKNMVAAIEEAEKSQGKRVFQTLPRHMRRRAMSHNVKRMPVRLRQRASYEMHNAASKTETLKKKSRYHRRKPKNLLDEYTRRQRKHVWLETHIWHAKRMKMIDAWGYRLADHPNDKGFRAAYRAAKNNCILQDMSYYGCIEVSGVQSQIIQAMRHLTSQETGLTMAAKHYLKGTREGNTMLYKFDQFPRGAISSVSFLWRQMLRTETVMDSESVRHLGEHELEPQIVVNDSTTHDHTLQASHQIHEKQAISQLWIWSHPASFDSVFDAVTEACNSVGRTLVEKDSKCAPDAVSKDSITHSEQLDQENEQNPLVNGVDHSELKVISHRYDLLRLRLTGPQSNALLTCTLKLSTELKQESSETKSGSNTSISESTSFVSGKGVNNSSVTWWQKLLDNPKDFLAQSSLWDKLKKASSPSVLPPGCVIGLTALDPRLYLPGNKKSIASTTKDAHSEDSDSCDETIRPSIDRTMNSTDKAVSKGEKKKSSFEDILTQWPADVAGSHIWDQSVRREVKETKMSEQELNRRRSELLVPSSQLDLNLEEISHIPVLLIQQPGHSGTTGDTGVGAGYGSGWDIILPSGWAMAFWIAFVYRGARTGALQESQTLALEQGVPFFPNDFPDTPAGEAYNKKLKEDGEEKYKRYPPAKRPNYDKLGVKSPFSPSWRELVKDWSSCEAASSKTLSVPMEIDSNSTESSTVIKESHQMDASLVRPFYVLRSLSKLSVLRDYVSRVKKPNKSGPKHRVTTSNVSLPVDLSSFVIEDPDSLVCVRIRMVNRNVPVPNSALAIPSEEDTRRLTKCKDASGPVEPLHKGSLAQISNKSLRNSCTREIVGYVSSGQFSLARGCGFGIGFCALPGLVKLLSSTTNNGKVVVLVRGPSTQQYRFAYLSIL